MKSHHVLFACLSLAAGPTVAVHGQTDVPVQFLLRDTPWSITVGYRFSSSGGDVKFGQLGHVPTARTVAPIGEATEGRIYDNGFVATDTPRLNEREGNVADGEVISTPGGRYEIPFTDEDGVTTVVGDYLSYTEGRTGSWGYSSADQVTADGRIAMSIFSATSNGASAAADGGGGGGAEVGLARRLGRPSSRVEWGLGGVIGLTDINSKTRGQINGTLHILTDYYSLNGATAPEPPYSGPSFTDLLDDEGEVITPGGFETTTPLGDSPLSRTETSIAGGAEIDGFWQIKGAYYLIRVGPHVRARLSERLAVYASAGYAGAYVGTTYRVEEILRTSNENITITASEERDASRFSSGFYGELAAEYWLTPRTGLYAGATYHTLGNYEQTVGGRTASIDLGKGVGFRLGVITRF